MEYVLAQFGNQFKSFRKAIYSHSRELRIFYRRSFLTVSSLLMLSHQSTDGCIVQVAQVASETDESHCLTCRYYIVIAKQALPTPARARQRHYVPCSLLHTSINQQTETVCEEL